MKRIRIAILAVAATAAACQVETGERASAIFMPTFFDGNAHPQILAFEYPDGFEANGCSGTLIASNVVLTAAHCFDSDIGTADFTIHVMVGINASSALRTELLAVPGVEPYTPHHGSMEDIPSVTASSSSVVIHPNYPFGVKNKSWDVALVILDTPIPRNLIAPLKVIDAGLYPSPPVSPDFSGFAKWNGIFVQFAGAGHTNAGCNDGAFSPVSVLEVQMYPPGLQAGGFFYAMQGTMQLPGPAACNGDSGGPILTAQNVTFGTNLTPWQVISVLSTAAESQWGPMLQGPIRPWLVQQALDLDNDGIEADADNCDMVYNPGQDATDTDGDGLPDLYCDDDDDDDGIPDYADNCVTVPNPGQANNDGDAFGDACDADEDGDFVLDGNDNCPHHANPDQANCNLVAENQHFGGSSGVHLGDACDPVPCARPDPVATTFVTKSIGAWAGGGNQYVCLARRGRSIRDRIDLTSMVGADELALATADLEIWFCPCEASSAAACKAPPWSCGLAPTAATAPGSRWLPLSLLDSLDMTTPLSQPLSAMYQPWAYYPQPGGAVGWDYQADYQSWVVDQQIWSPTPSDESTFGAGTDMVGMLWVEDSTQQGAGAHGVGACPGGQCSLAGSHLVDVGPDRATEVVSCRELPQYAPAPWWTYCAVCGDHFILPWGGLLAPAVRFFDETALLFSDAMSAVGGWTPGGGVDVGARFSRELIAGMNDPTLLWVGPSEPLETGLLPGMPRAMGLSADATRLVGQIEMGPEQFTIRSLDLPTGMAPRAGFAAAYSLAEQRLFVAGGQDRGSAYGELWTYSQRGGWTHIELDPRLAPVAARGAVYSRADRHLWFIEETSGRLSLGRIDTANGRTATSQVGPLATARDAWLITLAGGEVVLVTTTGTAFEVSQLAWDGRGARVVGSARGPGAVVAYPSVVGARIGLGIEVASGEQTGIEVIGIGADELRAE